MGKKLIKIISAAALAAVLVVVSLAGCGDNTVAVDYAGVYTLSRAETEGRVLEGDDIIASFPPDQYYIQIVDSERIVFVLSGERISTRYTLEGANLRVDDRGTVLFFVLSGNEISYYVEDHNTTLVFSRP